MRRLWRVLQAAWWVVVLLLLPEPERPPWS